MVMKSMYKNLINLSIASVRSSSSSNVPYASYISSVMDKNALIFIKKFRARKYWGSKHTHCWNYGSLLEWWLYYWNGGYTIEKVTHYWNCGYTIGMVAILLKRWLYYWNGGYTIEIVVIIFLYKLISSSFVIIPSISFHTSHTSLNVREKGSRVKEER